MLLAIRMIQEMILRCIPLVVVLSNIHHIFLNCNLLFLFLQLFLRGGSARGLLLLPTMFLLLLLLALGLQPKVVPQVLLAALAGVEFVFLLRLAPNLVCTVPLYEGGCCRAVYYALLRGPWRLRLRSCFSCGSVKLFPDGEAWM